MYKKQCYAIKRGKGDVTLRVNMFCSLSLNLFYVLPGSGFGPHRSAFIFKAGSGFNELYWSVLEIRIQGQYKITLYMSQRCQWHRSNLICVSETQGKLFDEKKQRSKISCKGPYKFCNFCCASGFNELKCWILIEVNPDPKLDNWNIISFLTTLFSIYRIIQNLFTFTW
jgi:hypothetical protein